MITDPAEYSAIKRKALAAAALTLDQKYAVLEGLYAEARAMGHFGRDDIMTGIEDTIRLAAALNCHVSTPPR